MGTLASSISGGVDKGTCQVKGDCSMSNTPLSKTIVCEEVFHEDSIPSEEEVIDYAKKIGIDPEGERHLLPIALNGLMQPLPEGWKPCFDITLKRWYYYNEQTKTSQWEHPLDNVYRNLVKRGRSEGYSSAADDDSKITREDLKSFEEVSDLLSSKSNDTKPDKLADMNELDKKDAHPRAHQPLLLRRKQLQHNPQFSPLQVAKMINNTMRENIEERGFKNVVTENRTFRVSPAKVGDSLTRYPSSNSLPKESGSKTLQPLRRAQTLDPIPTFISTNPKADPPIKGILRESSFSGLSNRNLARLNPIQGESPTSHEVDDEKKRSVRFADFERKSLDIKFHLSSSDGSTSEEASGSSSDKEGKPKREAEKFLEELNGFKMSLNAAENARNRINEKIVNTQAATKPLAINNLSDDDSASVSKDVNLQSLTDQVALKHSPQKTSDKNSENCQKPIDPEIISLRDAIKSIVGLEEESNSNVAQYEEKVAKEIAEKINQLKIQKIEKINKAKADLIKEEEAEKQKMAEESANKLNELKRKLNVELERKEKEIRDDHNKEINEVMERLKSEKSSRLAAIMADIKAEEDKMITDEKNKGLLRIEEVKSFFEAQTKESEEKCENEIKRLENVYFQKIESLKVEKEAELKRIQTEWDDKITANSIQNKSILDSALADHERNMASLKQQFQKEEEALKLSHAQQVEAWNHKLKKLNDKEPNSLTPNRDFEKMRCEKRLIEDKYRSLKDKYLQLKTDIEIAVERKLQNRSRKKKEEHKDEIKDPDEKGSNEAKKGKNNNPEVVVNDEKKTNKTKNLDQLMKEGVENDLSDDQYTSLSLTLPNEEKSQSVSPNRGNSLEKKKLSRGKLRLEHGHDRQGNVLDDIRTQLQELEEIEEQIPANSQGDTYLRYPFDGQGLSTSAEVDFYRHRVIVEQEAVRAARECLIQQKRELDARQTFLRTNNNSTMQQLQQQEKDLTEMEVSLYRTKALLGEKMIRLRLLGQTLNRIIEDCPAQNTNALKDNIITPTAISPGAFAFSGENLPLNMLQNLENIYSEIGEIQSQINKQQIDGIAEPAMDNLYLKLPPSMPSKPMRRVPSNRIEIETRLKDIQEWLHKTTPNQH